MTCGTKTCPPPPALVTIHKEGKTLDAVAQPTKHGFIFVLDRKTGKPVFPVDEVKVDTQSELKGEKPWPTQPIPRLPQPFMRQNITETDINPFLSVSSRKEVLALFKTYRHGGMFIPPGHKPSVVFPGFDGGAEWGGPAYDPGTGIFYINANEMANVLTMVDAKFESGKAGNYGQAGERLFLNNCMGCHGKDRKGTGNYPSLVNVSKKYNDAQLNALLGEGRRMMPSFKQLSDPEKEAIISYITSKEKMEVRLFKNGPVKIDSFLNLPYHITGYNKFLSKEGLAAISPPWGTLTAINLNTGKIVWKTPLGEEKTDQKGTQLTGTENYGGPVVTKGGLVFIAATKDGKIRAFDKNSGRLLWQAKLPAAGFATPSVYQENGREFLVIACGGGKLNTSSGDAFVAFALP